MYRVLEIEVNVPRGRVVVAAESSPTGVAVDVPAGEWLLCAEEAFTATAGAAIGHLALLRDEGLYDADIVIRRGRVTNPRILGLTWTKVGDVTWADRTSFYGMDFDPPAGATTWRTEALDDPENHADLVTAYTGESYVRGLVTVWVATRDATGEVVALVAHLVSEPDGWVEENFGADADDVPFRPAGTGRLRRIPTDPVYNATFHPVDALPRRHTPPAPSSTPVTGLGLLSLAEHTWAVLYACARRNHSEFIQALQGMVVTDAQNTLTYATQILRLLLRERFPVGPQPWAVSDLAAQIAAQHSVWCAHADADTVTDVLWFGVDGAPPTGFGPAFTAAVFVTLAHLALELRSDAWNWNDIREWVDAQLDAD